jgi:hypothetical protein
VTINVSFSGYRFITSISKYFNGVYIKNVKRTMLFIVICFGVKFLIDLVQIALYQDYYNWRQKSRYGGTVGYVYPIYFVVMVAVQEIAPITLFSHIIDFVFNEDLALSPKQEKS